METKKKFGWFIKYENGDVMHSGAPLDELEARQQLGEEISYHFLHCPVNVPIIDAGVRYVVQ